MGINQCWPTAISMLICHWPSVLVRLIACIVRWNGISLHGWLNSSSIQDEAVCGLYVSRMIQDSHPDHFHSITRTMRWNPDGWWEIRSDGLSNVTQITCANLESLDQMNRTWDPVLGGGRRNEDVSVSREQIYFKMANSNLFCEIAFYNKEEKGNWSFCFICRSISCFTNLQFLIVTVCILTDLS